MSLDTPSDPPPEGALGIERAPHESAGPLGPVLVVVAVALTVGALEATQAWLVSRARGAPLSVLRVVGVNMPWWILWGVLAIGIVGLARRYPLGRPLIWRIPLHVGVSVIASVLHLAAASLAILWAPDPPPGLNATFESQFRLLARGYFFMELATYWAILGGYTAWAASGRSRRAEEARRRLAVAAAEAEAERAHLERQMMEARLHALRTELNPHFLFNSLNGVSALAQNGDIDGAVTMLARLGELLRRTLASEVEETYTVADEIELVRLYLAIERVRYGARLDLVERLGEDSLDVLVPSFLLQPLVENAIHHGVAAVERTVRVEIETGVAVGRLTMRVSDSGPGLPADGPGEGVGLRNVRERLETRYGGRAELRLGSRAGGGAEARIEMPAELVPSVRVPKRSGAAG